MSSEATVWEHSQSVSFETVFTLHYVVTSYLNTSNFIGLASGLTGDEFQNKLANLGYLEGDEQQFQDDLNAGNVITIAAFLAAATTYP